MHQRRSQHVNYHSISHEKTGGGYSKQSSSNEAVALNCLDCFLFHALLLDWPSVLMSTTKGHGIIVRRSTLAQRQEAISPDDSRPKTERRCGQGPS
eukprot:4795837-Amphidinium_carterae.1